MNINIAEIARNQEEYIRHQMAQFYSSLDAADSKTDELIRRAAFLVRHNYVKAQDYHSASGHFTLSVQDASLARVTLSFHDDELICSCSTTFPCRHQLAAIFYLYQYIDSLSSWLESFRTRATAQLSLLKQERTPEAWLRFVQDVYKRNLYQQQNLNPYLLDSIYSDMMEQIHAQMPLEREWQHFYVLFTHFALLSHTWKHFSANSSEAATTFYRHFIEDELETLQVEITANKPKSRLFALDPFYKVLRELAHFFLLNQNGYVDQRLEIYVALWNLVFTTKKEREDELERLNTARHYSEDLSLDSIKAIFLVMLERTDELNDYLVDLQPKDVLSWMDLAKTAALNNQQTVRATIIHRIIPLLEEFITQWLAPQFRMSFVKRFDLERQGIELSEEQEEMLFSAYGKYGVQPYSEYLIKTGQYPKWAALHQLYPTSLAFLELCGLKTVFEDKPAVLLPLYHSLVLEEINQKSRQHYKSAVRLLKKMKAAAKKSGKNEFWNDYVLTIRKNYKRMRALQEEIEKGNLML
ncbi:hypothetical protein [Kurthia sibirica]|uniref:SWIM-type domain-containing protein n=1 Tax=Kurthia sibirica TaxID=202750 RepID=A0A2U3AKX6_9BACL|nr:hypothetical protein [Kurthia sibirica]PWI25197.1 hypothetical protein DEX24_09690 [Kurthia sibirica]GEK33286.1 hypothetical protein KSI01_08190 [Kurthia sibirica]